MYAKNNNPLYILLFLPSEFVDTFVDIVFATFIDTISITYTISSHAIESSTTLFGYLLFLQIHVLGFKV